MQGHRRIESCLGRPEHAVRVDDRRDLVRKKHVLVDRDPGGKLAHHDLHRRIGDVAGHLVHALRNAYHEAQLGDVTHLRLVVAVKMRRRLPPLIARCVEVAIDEDLLPGHEHVVEHDVAVAFVEAAR